MRLLWFVALAVCAVTGASEAAEWRVQIINAPARVNAVETVDGKAEVNAGGLWYRLSSEPGTVKLTFIDRSEAAQHPSGALSDARVVSGTRDIVRAWLAEPTARYDHGILGDAIEAGSLMIQGRDGKVNAVRLKDDAVFEDLEPRLADLDDNGHDDIVVVKSYLKRGSALAVIGARNGKYDVLAETPPIGRPHAWLNPAGIADYNGDGKTDIALVRMPHAEGKLELWTWADRKLRKTAEIGDASNHIAGSRALRMSATADFDSDGIADLAIPSFDRGRMRIIAFAQRPHELASVTLPAKAATNLALLPNGDGMPPMIVLGLSNGSLAVLRRDP
jgi:hypothetical protein